MAVASIRLALGMLALVLAATPCFYYIALLEDEHKHADAAAKAEVAAEVAPPDANSDHLDPATTLKLAAELAAAKKRVIELTAVVQHQSQELAAADEAAASAVASSARDTSSASIIPPVYGSNTEPLIKGLETCAEFRSGGNSSQLVMGPAGLFNTGTNYLEFLLRMNCRQRAKYLRQPHSKDSKDESSWVDEHDGPAQHWVRDVQWSGGGRSANLWQVPWGKHNPVIWRGIHYQPAFNISVNLVLPVMIVKDPLTWMKSMCRKPYGASFEGARLRRLVKTCPSPVKEGTQTNVSFQPNKVVAYKSLVHMWGEWVRAYADMKTPHLIVRYEDLLFNTEEVVKKICDCGGGVMVDGDFRQKSNPSKRGKEHQSIRQSMGEATTDRSKALAKTGDPAKRLEGYSANDLKFIRDSWDEELIKFFHYYHDVNDDL